MRTYYFTAAAAAAAADWYTFGIAPQLPVQNPPKNPTPQFPLWTIFSRRQKS